MGKPKKVAAIKAKVKKAPKKEISND
jgi:hypothetical protein